MGVAFTMVYFFQPSSNQGFDFIPVASERIVYLVGNHGVPVFGLFGAPIRAGLGSFLAIIRGTPHG